MPFRLSTKNRPTASAERARPPIAERRKNALLSVERIMGDSAVGGRIRPTSFNLTTNECSEAYSLFKIGAGSQNFLAQLPTSAQLPTRVVAHCNKELASSTVLLVT